VLRSPWRSTLRWFWDWLSWPRVFVDAPILFGVRSCLCASRASLYALRVGKSGLGDWFLDGLSGTDREGGCVPGL